MRGGERGFLGSVWGLLRTPMRPGRRGYLEVGWLLLVLFGLQLLTGILLSLYYEPSEKTAAASVQLVVRDVTSGWLVRGLHHWATSAILLLGSWHVLRLLLTGDYRREGAAPWYLALLLLVIALCQAFSGELLPWDDQAYWLVTHALDAIARVPLVGEPFATSLRGGDEVTGYTLRRAHAIHVMVLPWLSIGLVGLHLWFHAKRVGWGAGDAPPAEPGAPGAPGTIGDGGGPA